MVRKGFWPRFCHYIVIRTVLIFMLFFTIFFEIMVLLIHFQRCFCLLAQSRLRKALTIYSVRGNMILEILQLSMIVFLQLSFAGFAQLLLCIILVLKNLFCVRTVVLDRFLVESSSQRTDELDKTLLSIEGSVDIALQVSESTAKLFSLL